MARIDILMLIMTNEWCLVCFSCFSPSLFDASVSWYLNAKLQITSMSFGNCITMCYFFEIVIILKSVFTVLGIYGLQTALWGKNT